MTRKCSGTIVADRGTVWGMPARDTTTYPRCAHCRQPQYPADLVAHQSGCTSPSSRRGRPRKYPVGHRPAYHQSSLGWGGARRGERWQWQRATTVMIQRGVTRDDMSTDIHRLSTDGEIGKAEMIPVAYVRALLQISRRTMWRWQTRYQVASVRRRYPDGTQSATRYFLRCDVKRLLDLVYSQPQVRYYRPPKSHK